MSYKFGDEAGLNAYKSGLTSTAPIRAENELPDHKGKGGKAEHYDHAEKRSRKAGDRKKRRKGAH